MEIVVKTIKYVKTEGIELKLFLPDIPSFYFETGIRRSIAVIPRWTSWNIELNKGPEEIYGYDIICVYRSFESRIEKSGFSISELQNIISNDKSETKSLIEFISGTIDGYGHRTKEKFLADYNSVIEEQLNLLKDGDADRTTRNDKTEIES